MITPKILFALIAWLWSPFLPDGPDRGTKPETATEEPPVITRTIDASETFRPFPELVSYWNTSVQKAPAPVLAQVAEQVLGKTKIIRCRLNLDEMWGYRTRTYNFDFKLGVDKYQSVKEKHRES